MGKGRKKVAGSSAVLDHATMTAVTALRADFPSVDTGTLVSILASVGGDADLARRALDPNRPPSPVPQRRQSESGGGTVPSLRDIADGAAATADASVMASEFEGLPEEMARDLLSASGGSIEKASDLAASMGYARVNGEGGEAAGIDAGHGSGADFATLSAFNASDASGSACAPPVVAAVTEEEAAIGRVIGRVPPAMCDEDVVRILFSQTGQDEDAGRSIDERIEATVELLRDMGITVEDEGPAASGDGSAAEDSAAVRPPQEEVGVRSGAVETEKTETETESSQTGANEACTAAAEVVSSEGPSFDDEVTARLRAYQDGTESLPFGSAVAIEQYAADLGRDVVLEVIARFAVAGFASDPAGRARAAMYDAMRRGDGVIYAPSSYDDKDTGPPPAPTVTQVTKATTDLLVGGSADFGNVDDPVAAKVREFAAHRDQLPEDIQAVLRQYSGVIPDLVVLEVVVRFVLAVYPDPAASALMAIHEGLLDPSRRAMAPAGNGSFVPVSLGIGGDLIPSSKGGDAVTIDDGDDGDGDGDDSGEMLSVEMIMRMTENLSPEAVSELLNMDSSILGTVFDVSRSPAMHHGGASQPHRRSWESDGPESRSLLFPSGPLVTQEASPSGNTAEAMTKGFSSGGGGGVIGTGMHNYGSSNSTGVNAGHGVSGTAQGGEEEEEEPISDAELLAWQVKELKEIFPLRSDKELEDAIIDARWQPELAAARLLRGPAKPTEDASADRQPQTQDNDLTYSSSSSSSSFSSTGLVADRSTGAMSQTASSDKTVSQSMPQISRPPPTATAVDDPFALFATPSDLEVHAAMATLGSAAPNSGGASATQGRSDDRTREEVYMSGTHPELDGGAKFDADIAEAIRMSKQQAKEDEARLTPAEGQVPVSWGQPGAGGGMVRFVGSVPIVVSEERADASATRNSFSVLDGDRRGEPRTIVTKGPPLSMEEKLRHLERLFPSRPAAEIKNVLELWRGDVDAAANEIIIAHPDGMVAMEEMQRAAKLSLSPSSATTVVSQATGNNTKTDITGTANGRAGFVSGGKTYDADLATLADMFSEHDYAQVAEALSRNKGSVKGATEDLLNLTTTVLSRMPPSYASVIAGGQNGVPAAAPGNGGGAKSPWLDASPDISSDGAPLPAVPESAVRSLVVDFMGIVEPGDVRAMLRACDNNVSTCRVTLNDLYASEVSERNRRIASQVLPAAANATDAASAGIGGGTDQPVGDGRKAIKPSASGHGWSKVKGKERPHRQRMWKPVPGMYEYEQYKAACVDGVADKQYIMSMSSADADRIYASARDEARQHALARKVAFENANRAFAAGKHKEGQRLINLGKEFGVKMRLAQENAGRVIFAAHNARGGAASHTRILDLHGLHVKEALEAVETALVLAHREKDGVNDLLVSIITGRGKHSEGGARIKPAVIELLDRKAVPYSLANEGNITIRMR